MCRVSQIPHPGLFLILALLLLLWPGDKAGLLAEVIYLKNGTVIAGKVIGQSRTTMRVQTATGVRTIQKTAIRRVSYSTAEEQRIVREQRRKREQAEAARKAAEEARRKQQEQADQDRDDSGSDADPAREEITPGGYVLRSAAVPGWGHLAMGKTWTGAAYMGLGGLALYNLVTSRSAALAAESQNADDVLFNFALSFAPEGVGATERLATNLFLNSQAQGPYRSAIDRYDQSLRLIGAVYLVQLVHILYDAYLGDSQSDASQQAVRNESGGWEFDLMPRPLDSNARGRIPGPQRTAFEWSGRLGYTISF